MVKIEQMSRSSQCRKYLEHVSANSLKFKNICNYLRSDEFINLYIDYNT
jgi:hypothetical protein